MAKWSASNALKERSKSSLSQAQLLGRLLVVNEALIL